MLSFWIKIFDRFERLIIAITAFMLVLLSILVCTQVFTRYVICRYVSNINFFWIEEISVTLMMWIGLFGAAGCVWSDSHMNLNLFLGKIPSKWQLWIRVFIDILIGLYSFVLLKEGITLVRETMSGTMATLYLKLGYTYIILPISAGIMIIFSVVKVIRRVLEYYSKEGSNKND